MDIKFGGRSAGKTTALINEMKQQLADKDAEIKRLKIDNAIAKGAYDELRSSLAEARELLEEWLKLEWADSSGLTQRTKDFLKGGTK